LSEKLGYEVTIQDVQIKIL